MKKIIVFFAFFLAVTGVRAESILRVCDDVRDPVSLNPYKVFDEKSYTVIQQMLEGLLRFDENGKLEFALAERWERISPTIMRFYLRKNVFFHNGEPFNAHAVKFSLEKYINPATGYPGIGFVGSISRAEIVDDYTVDIITLFPDGLLLNRLAAFVLIVPVDYYSRVGDAGFAAHPIGTGPFAFENWEKGSRISLKKNPSHWQRGHLKLDRLEFYFVPVDKQVRMLLTNKLDLITEMPGTMTSTVMEERSKKVMKQKAFWTVGATMNTDTPVLSNPTVRQALNFALDKADLVRYDSFGNGVVLASLSMEGERGHNPELTPYPYNPEKAKKLLAAAGVTLPLRLKTHARVYSERAAKIIAAHLARVGVELEIKTFSDAESLQSLHTEKWDIGLAGLPDPMCDSFFIQSTLFYSKSPFSLMKNPEYDKRLENMLTTLEDDKRELLARELDKYIYENAFGLFTYQKIRTYGMDERVNFVPYISGMPHFFKTSMVNGQDDPPQGN